MVCSPRVLLLLLLSVSHAHPKPHHSSQSNPVQGGGENSALTEQCGGGYQFHSILSDRDARCLDGTPGSYLLKRGEGSGAQKWLILFEGGGWCYDLDSCYTRSQQRLGSSVSEIKENCRRLVEQGSEMTGDNRIYDNYSQVIIHYCDGGSYAGDAEIEHRGKKLFFKGSKIRHGVIEDVLTRFGMRDATSVVVAGVSAGGTHMCMCLLSLDAVVEHISLLVYPYCFFHTTVFIGLGVFLGIDQIREQIHSSNAKIAVGGVPDAGFFPDIASPFRHEHKVLSQGNEPEFDVEWGGFNYPKKMRHVFTFMNISAGVPKWCLIAHIGDAAKCIFSQYLLPGIDTPMLVLQVTRHFFAHLIYYMFSFF
jgi:hypothetical protein